MRYRLLGLDAVRLFSSVLALGLLLAGVVNVSSAPLPPCIGVEAESGAKVIDRLDRTPTPYGIAGIVIETPGYYRLNRDLNLTDVDVGILILSQGVEIDLGKHGLHALDHAIPILASGAVGLTIKNGRLYSSEVGISVIGSSDMDGPRRDTLVVDHVALHHVGPNSTDVSVRVVGVSDVSVLFTTSVGSRGGLYLVDWTRSVIADCSITSAEVGIHSRSRVSENVSGFFARLERTYIKSAMALDAGSVLHAFDNVMLGQVRLATGMHVFERNRIQAHDRPHALHVEGLHSLIRRNDFKGGTSAAIKLDGIGVRFIDNTVSAPNRAIDVSGSHSLIEFNELTGMGGTCGISFQNSDHAYRANIVRHFTQPLCGEGALDAGEPPDLEPMLTNSTELTDSRQLPPQDECPFEGAFVEIDAMPSEGLHLDRSGRYVVTADLVGGGFLITGEDVTLDLGAHAISCSSFCDTVIRLVGGRKAIISNGFVVGGVTTVRADAVNVLQIDRVQLKCTEATNCLGLRATNIGHMVVTGSNIQGIEQSASIVAGSGLIVGNHIAGLESGLIAAFSQGARIESNLLRGDDALEVWGPNDVSSNHIFSSSFGTAITTHSGPARIQRNIIDTRGGLALLLSGEGEYEVSWNLIRSGGIRIDRGCEHNVLLGNTLVDNTFDSQGDAGIEVDSNENVVGYNLILQNGCGMRFNRSTTNLYEANVVFAAAEGACGRTNEDGGDNIFPPGTCGNGYRGSFEFCEGTETDGHACTDFGYSGGLLRCNETCDGFNLLFCRP